MPSRRTRLNALFGAASLVLLFAGCGGGSSDPVVPPIQPPPPVAPPIVTPPPPTTPVVAKARFVYAANAADGTISIFAVDPQSGQLRANGYFSVGLSVHEVAVDPSNTFVYAAAGIATNAGVFAARIDAQTGALTPVAGSPFAAGTVPSAIAVDPTGRYVYAGDSNSDNVYAYSMDAASGALAPVAGSPFAAGDAPHWISIDPTGKFVYVANKDSHNVSAFRIDSATGSLATIAGSPFASGGFGPVSIAINSSGTLAFIANNGEFIFTGTVGVYTIDAATGALTPTASVPVANGSTLTSATINRAGTFLYVAGGGSNNVSAYAVSANGALTEVAGSPFTTGRGALSVIVDPSGSFVYVATGRTNSNYIAAFSVDPASGALSPLAATPLIAARGWPRSLAIASGATVAEFKSQFVYTANALSNDVSAHAVDATSGALTAIPGAPFAAGSGPVAVAIDPLNRYVYVANSVSNNISAFRIEAATGVLTPLAGSPFAVDVFGVNSITVDPSGRFVYVTGACLCVGGLFGAGGYAIDAATGALTPLAGSPYPINVNVGEGGARPITSIDPRGRVFYISGAGTTAALQINPMTGALTSVTGSPFAGQQSGHTSMAIHPAGRFAYVSLGGSFFNSIYEIDSIFDIGPGPMFLITVVTGALESLGATPVSAGSATSSLTIDATGRYAYALDGSANNVRGYSVNAQTGQLTALAGNPFAIGGVGGMRLATDASGRFVYVLNATSNSVSVLAINAADGSLSAVPGSPFAVGTSPRSIAISARVQ